VSMKKNILLVLDVLSAITCICIGVLLLLETGFQLSISNKVLFAHLHTYVIEYFIVDIGLRLAFRGKPLKYLLLHPTDVLVLYPYFTVLFDLTNRSYYFIEQVGLLGIMLGRLPHVVGLLRRLRFKPTQMLVIGFLFTIFLGSLILSLPVSLVENVPYIDALFTATSAVCVTGLVVNDIGQTFSGFGQVVILILMQLGGLGIMTFSVLLIIFFHKKVSQSESQAFQESYATFNLSETFRTIGFIFKLTFFVEAVGAIALFLFWKNSFATWGEGVFYSVFHSVSAFCNAGFSLFSDNLAGFDTNIPVCLTIASLIIVGGLGFPVMLNLANFRKGIVGSRLRLQTKMALVISGVLILFGTVAIFFGERQFALHGYSGSEQFLIAFFHSVSARTAGFNTVDLSLFHNATLLVVMVLMFIGASPGSTGGGIKTTTFGLLIVGFWNRIRLRSRIEVGGRTISTKNVLQALSIVILSVIVVFTFLYLVLFVEGGAFLTSLFEVVSAFGTAGFSLGMTEQLSNWGKMFIMILMFIGRLGTLTVAFALSRRKSEPNYAFPEEKVVTA
jgi:trk system potassium uptake protein TrkH